MKTMNVKNMITLSGLFSLYFMVILIVTTIILRVESEDVLMNMFTVIFKLFSNLMTAIITFYFTRKSIDSIHKETKQEESNHLINDQL